MKAVLVEDSRLARAEMKRLLSVHGDVRVVGEAENADDAEGIIAEQRPELLFLDIEMPGRNGFDLLASLEVAPVVIFTTAFSEFAVRAFEQNALDYLLKPVQEERLARALDRARQELAQVGATQDQKELLRSSDRIFVKDGEQCWFVALGEIRLFEVEGSYTRLYFGTHRPLILRTLNYLENRLDPQTFFRASRQHIVNLQWIKDVEQWFSGGLKLTMKDGVEVEVSRRQAQRFREFMSF